MKKNKSRSESAIQFEEIYREHHDPQSRAKKKILENRKQREDIIKEDNGL